MVVNDACIIWVIIELVGKVGGWGWNTAPRVVLTGGGYVVIVERDKEERERRVVYV